MKIEVRLPFSSRFQRTPLFTLTGRTFFGLWMKPNIVLDGDEKIITVSADQSGQLDLLAEIEYQDRTLFWAIAVVNDIRHPPDEVLAGVELIIPKIENIRVALLDTSENG